MATCNCFTGGQKRVTLTYVHGCTSIERAAGSDPSKFSQVGQVGANTTSFTDTTAEPWVTHIYRVAVPEPREPQPCHQVYRKLRKSTEVKA